MVFEAEDEDVCDIVDVAVRVDVDDAVRLHVIDAVLDRLSVLVVVDLVRAEGAARIVKMKRGQDGNSIDEQRSKQITKMRTNVKIEIF